MRILLSLTAESKSSQSLYFRVKETVLKDGVPLGKQMEKFMIEQFKDMRKSIAEKEKNPQPDVVLSSHSITIL